MSLTLVAGLVVIVAAVAAVLGGGGTIRFGSRATSDFEAKLRPVDEDAVALNARGKAEREGRSDGFSEFEAHVTGLELPDGAVVEFVVADVVLGTATVKGARTRLEFDSRLGQTVPPVEAGMVLEVRHKGKVLLAGQFYRD
ncbi:MAG: hypothetical protein ACR2GQ_06130 [Gemmatimonadota bacterium]|jgi:hypothetical protein